MWFDNIDIHSNDSKEITGILRYDSAHIIEMYMRLLGRYQNGHCKKLNIVCNESVKKPVQSMEYEGYIALEMPFNLNRYLFLQPKQKSAAILTMLDEAVSLCSEKWDWNPAFFENIKNTIEDMDYRNIWRYGQKAGSPDKKKTAYIMVEQDIGAAHIYLIVEKKGQIIVRKQMKEEAPVSWEYTKWLGKAQWVSDHRVVVTDRRQEEMYRQEVYL